MAKGHDYFSLGVLLSAQTIKLAAFGVDTVQEDNIHTIKI